MAEACAPPSANVRWSEKVFKRWLAVLIAVVTLLVSLTTGLHTYASNQAAECSRRSEENALLATGFRTRGQLQVSFARSIVRLHDELTGQAGMFLGRGRTFEAAAFSLAAQEIAKESPLLAPPYSTLNDVGWRESTRTRRYEADTWVITSTLLSERREAAAREGNAWGSKGEKYVAAIAIFAVTLFLLALASTIGGSPRRLFVGVGLGLATLTSLWVLMTALWPVPRVPDAALSYLAEGYGYAWQSQYALAIESYSRALEIDPGYANALAWRGQAWLNTQPPQASKAIQDLESASHRKDRDASIFWNLGWAFYLNGDWAGSLPASERALTLNSKICGPAFNIALVHLALGRAEKAEGEYEAALSRCERILKESLNAGLAAPYSLWDQIEAAAEDIQNLLCQTHQRYCYRDREANAVRNVVNPEAVLMTGERYLKRIKEALTALEYRHTKTVIPTGAQFSPLTFGTKVYDASGRFQSYDVRDHFSYRGETIYALWDYAGMKPATEMVWKVYRDGSELPELRHTNQWKLDAAGAAEKQINSWFVLEPGHYDIQVYGNDELLATGAFDLDAEK